MHPHAAKRLMRPKPGTGVTARYAHVTALDEREGLDVLRPCQPTSPELSH